MTDLISRQDAIAWLRGFVRIKDGDYSRGAEDAINHCIEALTNMPSYEQRILQDMVNGIAVTRDGVRVDPHNFLRKSHDQ